VRAYTLPLTFDGGGLSLGKGGMSVCRSCHTEHDSWIRCEVAARRSTNDMANTVPVVANSVANAEPGVANKTYKYRDAEKRRAYQRELMRKRRAGV
jgi:hypothetical protein